MELFRCTARDAVLSTRGCASDWRLAPEKTKRDPLHQLRPCLGCPIGATNAGEPPRDIAPAVARKARRKTPPPKNPPSDAPLARGNLTFVCESINIAFRFGPFLGDEVRGLRHRFTVFRKPINGRPAFEVRGITADHEGVWLHSTVRQHLLLIRPRNWDRFAAALNLQGPIFATGIDAYALLALCDIEDAAAAEDALSSQAITQHVADRPWLVEYPPVARTLELERRANRDSHSGAPAKIASTIDRTIHLRYRLLRAGGMSNAETFAAIKQAFASVPRLAKMKQRAFERWMQRQSEE